MKLRTLITGAATALLGIAAVPLAIASATPSSPPNNVIVVQSNTASGENQPGWLFNRDVSTSTPFEFNSVKHSIGLGSLYVKPIAANPSDKFIAENFLRTPVADVSSIAYDFLIAGNGTTASANQFYLNVYTTIDNSTRFYDCRYDYVPTTGSTSNFTTATFNATDIPVLVTRRGTADPATPTPCPTTLAGMPAGSYIRAFSISVGDTSASDTGLAGYLDKVVVAKTSGTTTYDFEPTVGPPTNKDQCKNDGWKTFNNPSFKNEGKCIDYVKDHSAPGEVKGTIRLINPNQKIKFNIDDHDGWWHHNKKDTIEYWNFDYPENGGVLHYKADVLCVGGDKSTKEARVLYQIPAGHPGLSGLYIGFYVKEVKNGPDLNSQGVAADLATGTVWCNTGSGVSLNPYTVTKGHVEVD